MWLTILIASGGTFLEKIIGYLLPHSFLERESIRRMTGLLPVSLLSALVIVQTFAIDTSVTVDARIVGVAVAVVALILKAPFIVVVFLAAAATGVIRWLGWMN
jgi:hypothetical protein